MRVELRVECRNDLLEAAWFYEQQREGLGDDFTSCLFGDLEQLQREAGRSSQSTRQRDGYWARLRRRWSWA